ncbi:PQQ-binding-like beta-propeller repeat protein [candidate division KSB1 bacterium]|nr:PQQ-binding-like beta-propeller repeat protein [candidate division KSB1 bacterium]
MKMETNKKNRLKALIAKRVAIVSFIFAVLLSILLIANTVQMKTVDPLNSPALTQLMKQLQNNPNDQALKEQIRALDLLARKAYFTYQWQIRTGTTMLFVSVLVLLISLKTLSSMKRQLPDLNESDSERTWMDRILSRKSLVIGGVTLFALAFLGGALSESALKDLEKDPAKQGSFASRKEMAENWPFFRGPNSLGVATMTSAPTEWDGESGENIAWKVEIPKPGFNSPIIWEEKLFLSGADEDLQQVYCYDTDSGELLWTSDIVNVPGTPAESPDVTDDTGYAAPTMATDGQRVFTIFATGDLACLDMSGNILWSKNLGLPDNHYGHSSSLLTFEDLLIVQYDHNESQQLYAFNTFNGNLVYETPRPDVQISWASPVLIDFQEQTQVVLNSNPFVMGYDVKTGKELWRIDCMSGEVAPSVAFAEGRVFAVNEFALLAGIQLEPNPSMIWEYEDELSEVASPVATSELLIMASSYGTISCLDTKTGELIWSQEFDDGFYSSPILVGDIVYALDLSGVMHMFKMDKVYTEMGSAELGQDAMATPVFMHDRIYIRGVEHLFCIES